MNTNDNDRTELFGSFTTTTTTVEPALPVTARDKFEDILRESGIDYGWDRTGRNFIVSLSTYGRAGAIDVHFIFSEDGTSLVRVENG